MLSNIIEALLNQPVKDDLRALRQGAELAELQLHADRMQAPETVNQLPQCGSQSELFKNGGRIL